MKKLVLLLSVLLTVNVCVASDIEGDANNDGVLSGSEQYLLSHPDTTISSSDKKSSSKSARAQVDVDSRIDSRINENPEAAQRRLEQAAIVNDRIAVREDHERQVAGQIADNNRQIAEYNHRNQMAIVAQRGNAIEREYANKELNRYAIKDAIKDGIKGR
jgi:hypothetical protein